MSFARVAFAIASLLLVSACSSNRVNLKYESASAPPPISSEQGVVVGAFSDSRDEKDPHWFGAIRGGFGNPIKVLNADKPISAVVADAFSEGLKERKALANNSSPGYEIRGTIKRFECDQFARREANIELEINVKRLSDGAVVFHGTKNATIVSGSMITLSAGIFGSVEELRMVAEQTLRQVVDKTLDDPEFVQAVR
jgi:hypothetical protein